MAKGPKYLNPADKARKEARKKELKKNKKQRQQVRSAAIENRNPEQILAELEQLDKQEFDPSNVKNPQQPCPQPAVVAGAAAPSASDLLYKDKRKRLKELFERCLAHYEKEDPERHAKLKTLEAEYEAKHKKVEKEFEAVKAAAEVSIEEVFLPPEPDAIESEIDQIADDDPLMSESVYITPHTEGIKLPGCPPGPPPDLKQLVDSLKNPVQLPAAPLILPPHLLSGMGANLQGLNKKQSARNQPGPVRSSNQQQRNKRPYPSRNEQRPPQRYPDKAASGVGQSKPVAETSKKRAGESQKSAVIESKPVIFMPKATKFVPASVRSKVAQNPPPAQSTKD